MACHSLFSPSPMFPSSPTGRWSMTSRQSSTRLCRLSWAAGERGSTTARRIQPSRISMCLYHTDNNVHLGAPTGSGKTICTELAMLYLFNTQLDMKVVCIAPYIAPLKAMV